MDDSAYLDCIVSTGDIREAAPDHFATVRAALAVNPSHPLGPSIAAVCDDLERVRHEAARLRRLLTVDPGTCRDCRDCGGAGGFDFPRASVNGGVTRLDCPTCTRRVMRAEIDSLTAARAVPPDVEAAIDAYAAAVNECGDTTSARRGIHSAVADTIDNAVADFIDIHAKRITGDDWMLMDADDQSTVAGRIHDVLNHLRADADGTVIDGRASQRATAIADDVRAWCVECDVDILTDGESGERCDWLTFVRGEQDANHERDRAIERLVEEGHAADVDAAEKMVRVVPLVPARGPIVEVP